MKRNGTLYSHLLNNYADFYLYDKVDICTLTRKTFKAAFGVFFAIWIGVTILGLLATPYFLGIVYLMTGLFDPGLLFFIGLAFNTIMYVALINEYIDYVVPDYKPSKPSKSSKSSKSSKPSKPSKLVLYKSIKEKTCFFIDVKD